jgi:hypothetical protein
MGLFFLRSNQYLTKAQVLLMFYMAKSKFPLHCVGPLVRNADPCTNVSALGVWIWITHATLSGLHFKNIESLHALKYGTNSRNHCSFRDPCMRGE